MDRRPAGGWGEGGARGVPRWGRRLRLAGLGLLLLGLLAAVGDRGLLRLHALWRTRAELAREVARLKAANALLAEEARALREDPTRLEAIARDELGLVRSGDIIYDFRPAREAPAGHP